MQKTNISYLTHTWSPIAMRCERKSEACLHCWHLIMADRLAKNPKISEDRRKAYAGGVPILIEKELDAPLKLKKPAIIGTLFMGDLFHESIKTEWIDRIFNVMVRSSKNRYLVLTKRPERMRDYWMGEIPIHDAPPGYTIKKAGRPHSKLLDHIYLGVTVENQKRADERIPILLQIPAAVRFISVEPMLSKIDLGIDIGHGVGDLAIDRLNWVICGTESGQKRRPAKIEWIRDLKDQCVDAGVPFFLKQIEINGKVSHDMYSWPEDLRIRSFPAHGLHKDGKNG